LRRATAAAPDNAVASARLADVLMLKGDWAAAEAEARRSAGTTDPQGIGALELATVLSARNRHPEAIKVYQQALEKNPDNAVALEGLAASLAAQGNKAEALEFLREHAQKHPESVNARLALGRVLAAQGQGKEAAQVLESLITDQPGTVGAYLALAAMYPTDQNARMDIYRRGLVAIPGNVDIGLMLAGEHLVADRVDEAIRLQEELLAANPGREPIINDLVATLLDYRYQDPAVLKRAVQLAQLLASSQNPLWLDTVGWAYYRTGDNERALQFLKEAAAGAADVPAIRYHLGMARLKANDRAGAREELRVALARPDEKFPGVDEARKALAGLGP
jgi:tetratricopeptide (TPR) repeat protein